MYDEVFYIRAGSQSYKFFGEFSFDKDAEDCMGTGTLTMPYHPQLWAFWEPGFTELQIYGGIYDESRLFAGRTRAIKQTGEKIEISLQDMGWKLKKLWENDPQSLINMGIKKAFIGLVREAGMIPVILGLKQDYIIQDTSKDTTSASSSTTPGQDASATGPTASTTTTKKEEVPQHKFVNVSASYLTTKIKGTSPAYDRPVIGTSFKIAEKQQASSTTGGTSGQTIKVGGCIVVNHRPSGKKPPQPLGQKSWTDYCPGCTATGKLLDNPKHVAEGEVTCGNCGADFDGNNGWDKTNNPRWKLTPCGGKIGAGQEGSIQAAENTRVTTKVIGPAPTADTATTEQTVEPQSYEDVINKICEDATTGESTADLIWYTTQYNECVLVDYQSLMEDIDREAFILKPEYVEYPSFDMDVNQFGYANTAIVKYANGTVKQQYEDLVRIFGEVPKTYNAPTLNKTQATAFAKAKLATLLRDFAMEIRLSVVHSGAIQPGGFIKVTNPITEIQETYYVSGVNVTHSPTSTLKSSVSLLYAPKNPEVTQIPEMGGPSGGQVVGGIQAKIDQIGREEAAYADVQGVCSALSCFLATKRGDCWADSYFLYDRLTKAGIKARYRCCNTGPHVYVEYNDGTGWKPFPYHAYGGHHYGPEGCKGNKASSICSKPSF